MELLISSCITNALKLRGIFELWG